MKIKFGPWAALVGALVGPFSLLHSPPSSAQAPEFPTAYAAVTCDHGCLTQFARDYMQALSVRDASRLKSAPRVRFTENNVELNFGQQGLWATATAVKDVGLIAADTEMGQAAWIGWLEEHGKPVYFGLRLAVRAGRLVEAETIVVRNTGLPLPFADVSKLQHDPLFNEVLPPAQRRSRERLRAVADSYFSTVELNDGVVFAPFTEDCGRLENGILTTAAGATGSAGSIAPGCEPQLRLGLYRINKRIRERRYPLIDVERGVVVATGFFDHANEFDRYKTTDGIERRTLLKWPNSISLVEAFRINDGRIQRIEAVFTYVPYFMHSPFYVHPPAPPLATSGVVNESTEAPCDAVCLIELADRTMTAMANQKHHELPWAPRVRFTENSVRQNINEGIWGSIRAKSATALKVADPQTQSVVWYGTISDHDAPAWFAMRLRAEGRRIADIEVFAARERNPGPFTSPKQFVVPASLLETLPIAERSSRERMIALAEGYASTVQQNDGQIYTQLKPQCERRENGVLVSDGEVSSTGLVAAAGQWARGCDAQLKLGLYRPVERVRNRRVLAVDEARGLVAMASFADIGLAARRYPLANGRIVESADFHPSTREQLEVFRIRAGRIESIDAVSVNQPYGMPVAW